LNSGFFIINLSAVTNKIIIDGWNLAWKIPHIAGMIPDDLERARVQLNIMLQNYFQGRHVRFKVVYDGKQGYVTQKGYDRTVETKFSRDPEKADHLIAAFIKKQKNPGQWTVITSDRELADRVSGYGAQVVDSDSFLEKMNRPATQAPPENPSKSDPNLGPEEIAFWLKTFKKD
jgi:predicted RNA-binding protein with PIN domain